jgi:hypothetical protein
VVIRGVLEEVYGCIIPRECSASSQVMCLKLVTACSYLPSCEQCKVSDGMRQFALCVVDAEEGMGCMHLEVGNFNEGEVCASSVCSV